MKLPTLPIETDRLLLRAFAPGDIEAVAAYHALPEAQRFRDARVRSRADVEEALDAMRAERALNRPGDMLSLAVVRRSDDRLVGQVGLRWHDATAAQGELRFVFNPIFRSQGYAGEAVRAMLDLGFADFDLHRIFTRCDARNQAIARMLKSLGMRLEAHYREHALFRGEWDEELHFAVLDREWRSANHPAALAFHRVA